MRIAVDLRSLIEPLPSGITEYTKQISRQFALYGSGHDFVQFSNSRRELPQYIRDVWAGSRSEWKISRWPNKIFNGCSFISGLPHLDTFVGGADVFFMPNLNFANFTRHCKLVVTVHDLSFLKHGFYSLKGRLWHKMIRPISILKRADAIIAVSKSTAIDLLDSIPALRGRVSVIHSGVDEKYFRLSPVESDRVNNKYRLPGKYILFLGTAEKRKNLQALVLAWRKIRNQVDCHPGLVIAGKPQDYKEFDDPDILFLGYVPEEDKPGLYRNALLLCYPSFFEGFGLPILEAMACGTPVVTSYATSLAEIVGSAGLMVNPYSIAEISTALIQLISDDALRKTLIERGMARARQFTWEMTGRKTLELITSL